MATPPAPEVIGDDIMRSFDAWAKAEVARIAKTYEMTDLLAARAVALTVLGSTVRTLRMLGRTTEHIIGIIKGKKPS